MIRPNYNAGSVANGGQARGRVDGCESAALFRATRVTASGLKSIYEEEWMKPVFAALAAEMEGFAKSKNAERVPTARWLRMVRAALAEELLNLRSTEIMMMRMLPKMETAASARNVRQIFEDLEQEAKDQGQRLDELGELLDVAATDRRCLTMEAMVFGIREVIAENQPGWERDDSLMAAALKALDYQAGCYECARTLAYILGLSQAAELLEASMQATVTAQARLRELEGWMKLQGGESVG
ncbi:MAG: DUF892 family protein [Opitutales bacterium]|jgi:ferritin-like metal-binding protein YciE